MKYFHNGGSWTNNWFNADTILRESWHLSQCFTKTLIDVIYEKPDDNQDDVRTSSNQNQTDSKSLDIVLWRAPRPWRAFWFILAIANSTHELQVYKSNIANKLSAPAINRGLRSSFRAWRALRNTKGPAISNCGYPGGANMGGVRKIFDDFWWGAKNFCYNFMGREIVLTH